MKRIPLGGKFGKGKFALIDNEDFERVSKHGWHLEKNGYVMATITIAPNVYKPRSLHRFIMNVTDKRHLDHKNLNKLDCRKNNLRYATYAENNRNRSVPKNNTTGYKGVYIERYCHSNTKPRKKYLLKNPKFRVCIKFNKKKYSLGLYKTAKEAAVAYNEFALKHFGEFAQLNVITE